jgi:hypothetical protein
MSMWINQEDFVIVDSKLLFKSWKRWSLQIDEFSILKKNYIINYQKFYHVCANMCSVCFDIDTSPNIIMPSPNL